MHNLNLNETKYEIAYFVATSDVKVYLKRLVIRLEAVDRFRSKVRHGHGQPAHYDPI